MFNDSAQLFLAPAVPTGPWPCLVGNASLLRKRKRNGDFWSGVISVRAGREDTFRRWKLSSFGKSKNCLLAISYSFGNKMQRVATFCWKPFPSRKMQGPRFVEGLQDNTRHKKHLLVCVRPMLARLRGLWEVSGRSLRGLWEVCGDLWEEHRRLWQLCALHGLLGCLGSNYSNSFHLKHKSSIEMS